MQEFITFYKHLINPDSLTVMLTEWGWAAYILLFCIVFAETGLLVGFCLPGDSLLFVAGFVCSVGNNALNIFILGPLLMLAAILGDNTNYWLGRGTGPKIFSREDSLFFHKKHLVRTQHFYEKHGPMTIIYARFVPIVRTFAPFVAGMGKMRYARFLAFSIGGGAGWIVSMLTLGYFLGQVGFIKHNLDKAVVVVVLISLLPIFLEFYKARRRKAAGTE